MTSANANTSRWWQQLDLLRRFVVFLAVEGPVKIYQLWRLTASNFESQLAVVTTLKNLGRPLFQDYSREGRLIGFFLRIGRVLIGVIIQMVLLVVFLAIVLAWLILPIIITYRVFDNIFSLINS